MIIIIASRNSSVQYMDSSIYWLLTTKVEFQHLINPWWSDMAVCVCLTWETRYWKNKSAQIPAVGENDITLLSCSFVKAVNKSQCDLIFFVNIRLCKNFSSLVFSQIIFELFYSVSDLSLRSSLIYTEKIPTVTWNSNVHF